jgi:hypothetical protein
VETAKPANVLAIPLTAVLDSGTRKLVHLAMGDDVYRPVEVKLGPRSGDSYPVLDGLKEGDRVVVRGNFLLDSQFQIAGLPSLLYPDGQAPSAGHAGHGGNAPAASANKPKGQVPATDHSGHGGNAPAPPLAPPPSATGSKPPVHKH